MFWRATTKLFNGSPDGPSEKEVNMNVMIVFPIARFLCQNSLTR